MPPRLIMKKRRAAVSLAAVAAVLLAGGLTMAFSGGGTPSGESYVDGNPGAVLYAPGHRAQLPAFSGKTLTGAPVSFSAYRGRVVVLNFWGSWCAPCRAEAPALAELSRKLGPEHVRFVGVDIRDQPDSAQAFMQTFNVDYPSLNDPADEIALEFHSTVPPAAIPTTLIIDRKGRIAARVFGASSYADLQALISKVIGQPA